MIRKRNRYGRKQKKAKGNRKAAIPVADMEQDIGYETLLKKEVTPFDSPVSIHVHSKRKRLVDADAVSAKAAIDGLVHAGLLHDDSPEFVMGVSYSQEKVDKYEEEETILEVKEI